MSRIAKTHTPLLLAVVALMAGATQASAAVDLRSPDARDVAGGAQTTQGVDLRSPDARDAGSVVARPTAPGGQTSGDDFNWAYLAIVVGGLALAGGLATVTLRRRRLARVTSARA